LPARPRAHAGIVWPRPTTAADRLTHAVTASLHFSLLYSAQTRAFAYANAIASGKFRAWASPDYGVRVAAARSMLKSLMKYSRPAPRRRKNLHFCDTDVTAAGAGL